MRILGIDCGGEYTGYGVVEMYETGKLCCLSCGAIKLSPREALPRLPGSRTEARISWLTLLIGYGAAFIAHFSHRMDWALGLFFGAGLAWINFSGLRRGLDLLVLASQTQHGHEKPQVPWWNSVLAVFRYALIGLAAYVIFIYLFFNLDLMVCLS